METQGVRVVSQAPNRAKRGSILTRDNQEVGVKSVQTDPHKHGDRREAERLNHSKFPTWKAAHGLKPQTLTTW